MFSVITLFSSSVKLKSGGFFGKCCVFSVADKKIYIENNIVKNWEFNAALGDVG